MKLRQWTIILLMALLSVTAMEATAQAAAEAKVADSQLVLLPVKDDPTISFRLWFQVGAQNDPPGKEGLAALTASMLAEASTQKDRFETILQKLFPLAAGYDASVSMEMTIIHGRVHKDNLAVYYPFLMQAVLMPAFQQDDLDRLKADTLNYLENVLRYASDEELGKAVLYNTIFAGTPYGHISAGTIESVRGITLDDVRRFYREHYTRENVVIGLGGGYDAALIGKLQQDLGKLPAGKSPAVSALQPKPIHGLAMKESRGIKVTIVEKDAAATAISIGYPIDVLRGQKEWYPLAVANSWLGQHRNSSSHLYQVIREARGLNYGDYSYIEHFPHGGMLQVPPQNVSRRQQIFEIWIRPVPNPARHFALRAALRELKKLVDQGLTPAESDLTRKFLHNYVLNYAPTTMERLGYSLDDRFYGVQGSFLEKFRQRMSDVTLGEVNAAVKRHLQYGNLQIVIVTKDAKALKEALVSDAPSPITYPTPKPEAVLEEDKLISTFPLKVRSEDVTIAPVAELFVK